MSTHLSNSFPSLGTGKSQRSLSLNPLLEVESDAALGARANSAPLVRLPSHMRLQRDVSVELLMDQLDKDVSLPVKSVVQLYVTGVRPNYTSPWNVSEQEDWTGSGFCIDQRRIVTNAHCVEHATVLQVQRQDHPKKWRARATTLAHDIDLAIVEVDEEEFWSEAAIADLAPADLAVELYSEVNAIGFPTGGSTLCVTKGVISRFDAQLYAHPSLEGIIEDSKNSPGPVFILQVDSAINPGNSGGPAVDRDGRVIGVASSGMGFGQNIGYVIPVSIVHLFLKEVLKTGKWSGVSELGFSYRLLESDSYRTFLGMDTTITGVLVEEVAPLGAVNDKMHPGDVLTQIDSQSISNEGKVSIMVSGQSVYVDIGALVTCKPKGDPTTFSLLRKSDSNTLEKVTLSLNMAPIPPLAPRFHGYDVIPEYVLIGGLVFSRLSVPLAARMKTYPAYMCLDRYKKDATHEAVVLVNILRHDINIGCEMDDELLESVNGTKITSLVHLAAIAKSIEEDAPSSVEGISDFVRIFFRRPDLSDGRPNLPDIVLQRSKVAAANLEICEAHSISQTISPSLLETGKTISSTSA